MSKIADNTTQFPPRLALPQGAARILDRLEGAGYEAYAVGGCVRDSLLGLEPQDWDITTDASPAQVKALFGRTIDTGLEHGTVTVMLEGRGYEVTTYRLDGEYQDGRRPKQVFFTSSLEEDLRRRDFTVNAMAYNPRRGLVDCFGGAEDLRRGIVRCVGDPRERFGEDALRLLRALRFCAQLGFVLDPRTEEAIAELAPSLSRISRERICQELVKTLLSDRPQHWQRISELGLGKSIMPPGGDRSGGIGREWMAALPKDKGLRLAALCAGMQPGEEGEASLWAKAAMEGLRLDNKTIRQVRLLVCMQGFGSERGIPLHCIDKDSAQGQRWSPEPGAYAMGKMLWRWGELFPALWVFQEAKYRALGKEYAKDKQRLEAWRAIYLEMIRSDYPTGLGDLAVDGRDLEAAGIGPGREVGRILESLMEWVLEDPSRNEKAALLAYAKRAAAGEGL